MNGWVIGVDGGGTRTRAVLLDPDGAERAREEGPSAVAGEHAAEDATAAVVEACASVLRTAGREAPVAALWAGLAGAGREVARAAVERALAAAGLAERVAVGTDVAAAFHHAFGDGPGILLISGTGSIAWGRSEDGREARAGGWGPLLGDEGSAYRIASAALGRLLQGRDGREPEAPRLESALLGALELADVEALVPWSAGAARAEVAALAPTIAQVAGEGDQAASAILRDATAALEAHVAAVYAGLAPWEREPEVALAGGLLRPGRALRDPIESALERAGLRRAAVEPDAALGAARLACTLLD